MTRKTRQIADARRAAIAARRALTAADRERLSAAICSRLLRSHEFLACRTLACYLPASDEVDPSAVIERAWRMGKRVYAPVVGDRFRMFFRRLAADTTLARNRYGLWEPDSGEYIATGDIDLVVTPVVAFDADGHRIGMGSGYFDRCFASLRHRKRWRRPKLVGLAFESQRAAKIEPNSWDVRLYKVLTENL